MISKQIFHNQNLNVTLEM